MIKVNEIATLPGRVRKTGKNDTSGRCGIKR